MFLAGAEVHRGDAELRAPVSAVPHGVCAKLKCVRDPTLSRQHSYAEFDGGSSVKQSPFAPKFVRFQSVTGSCGGRVSWAPGRFGGIVPSVYKPVRAKDSRFVLLQDSLPIIADSEFSRYKDGTRSTCALAFLKGSYGTCRSDRCPLSSFICNSLTPFHGGNTGSNPVGDAKSIV